MQASEFIIEKGNDMKAVVVKSFGDTPSFEDFCEPAASEGEIVVKVRAAPLSPIVKALASGRHYTSSTSAGFVPGVDGVGIDEKGQRVYFLFPKVWGEPAVRVLRAATKDRGSRNGETLVPKTRDSSSSRASVLS
jgi:NADPH:quinone reductase-like Zn-dependent oxidoreductase